MCSCNKKNRGQEASHYATCPKYTGYWTLSMSEVTLELAAMKKEKREKKRLKAQKQQEEKKRKVEEKLKRVEREVEERRIKREEERLKRERLKTEEEREEERLKREKRRLIREKKIKEKTLKNNKKTKSILKNNEKKESKYTGLKNNKKNESKYKAELLTNPKIRDLKLTGNERKVCKEMLDKYFKENPYIAGNQVINKMKLVFPDHHDLVDKHFDELARRGFVKGDDKFPRGNVDDLLEELEFDELKKMIAGKSGRRLAELPGQTGPTLITLSFVILAAMFVGLYFIKRWFQKRTRRDSFGFLPNSRRTSLNAYEQLV